MSTAVSYTLRTQCTHRSCQPCHLAPGNPIYVATLLCCYSGFAGASVLSWAFVGADVCADAVLYSAPSNLLNCLPGQFSVLKNCWATLRRISEPRGSACPTISVILRGIVFPDNKEHRCAAAVCPGAIVVFPLNRRLRIAGMDIICGVRPFRLHII